MKASLVRSNFFIKPSIFLGAAVLVAASLLSSVARAEDDPLMPNGPNGVQPFDPNPGAPDSLTRRFMTYGVDADGTTIPTKTLRITNNTEQTVFPIMRDPNSNTTKNKTIGLYDPYDPVDKEYRGYIGYEEGGKYFFGLKKHETILVSLPLVFWNGARIGVGTDGKYVAPTQDPNPLRYRSASQRSITRTPTGNGAITNGVVMWYRADGDAEAPNDDAEDQLAEWTIRDHVYLVNPKITAKTNNEIPDNQLVTLINYDVSNVDNLYLPLAMAANDVWVTPQRSGRPPDPNRNGWRPGSDPDVYGWTGAINTIDFLQGHIRDFTADNNALLGEYFGKEKHGWPFYNIPNGPNGPRKIPSGANIFAQSPLKAVPSSYGDGNWENDKYMLSSGGTLPIKAGIGWAGGTPDVPPSDVLHLNTCCPIERAKIAFLQEGYLVKGLPPDQPPTPNPIQPGTTILQIIDRDTGTIKLSKPLIASSMNCSFEFTRPVNDYASDAMIRLWYSWAQYYLAHWNDKTPGAPTGPTPITASIQKNTATMYFDGAHPDLVEGMAVTGPGLDDADTEKGRHQGDAVILRVNKNSVILSQVANQSSTNGHFKVRPPQSLLRTPSKEGDAGFPLIGNKFKFSDDEPEWHKPYNFSQQVYLIMASMNQIGEPNNNSISKFMQNIVGANMGFIFTNQAKLTDDGKMVTAMIRDMIKSVLRGVWDFTKFPDDVDDHGNHLTWYPDPKQDRGNQGFNVFNLDPFVWFVHVQLGFSGYGFSVDDDTADVGAGGASELQLSVVDTGGLKNLNPWTIQAPYGPVKNVSASYSGPATDTNGDTLYHAIESVGNETPIRITTKGQHNLANGDTIFIDQVKPDTSTANGKFKINNVTSNTFELFDPVTGRTPIAPNGRYISGGRWFYPNHPYIDTGADLTKVFYRVTGDDVLGTFQGTLLSANGVDRNKQNGKKFRVWRLGRQNVGRLLLDADLTDVDGVPLPAGTYTFSFFGVAESGHLLGGGPPFRLAAIRDDIHDEMTRIQKRLNRLEKRHSDMKNSARARRTEWLELRIDVLKGRLQYPTDEVLKDLEESVEARKSVGPAAIRNFRQELNRRLSQLGSGG
jgi:hypothetical protein